MDGRLRGVDGGLVVSVPVARVKDTLPTPPLHTIAPVQGRIALDADARVLPRNTGAIPPLHRRPPPLARFWAGIT
jgi:hypothetical protein